MKYLYIVTLIILSSCNLAPKYADPKPSIDLDPINNEKDVTKVSWKEFFKSKPLQQVIEITLENNQDLKTAYLNIESSRATYDIERKKLIPTINATTNLTRQRAPAAFAAFTPKSIYRANLNIASYEIDFYGKIRNAKNSALESFFATKEAKNIMEISLITQTANAYIQLLTDQNTLALIEESLKEQKNKLEIIKSRKENGRALQTDVLNYHADYEMTKLLKINYQKIVELDKNNLMLLMGDFDKSKIPQFTLSDISFDENIFDFMPSKTLLLRPDIKEAEHKLKAANADIGVARAAFFPTISLSANYGYYSRDLSSLFDSGSWSFAPTINLPIFDGGKNRANLRLSKIQKKTLISNYQKTIQNAFKEVLDELEIRKNNVEQMNSYQQISNLKQEHFNIIKLQRLNGTQDSIAVSNSHLEFITAKSNEIEQKREYFRNLIDLYKVLGGNSSSSDI